MTFHQNITDYQYLAERDTVAGLFVDCVMVQAIDTTASRPPTPREPAELARAKSMLKPFYDAGCFMFPLAHGTKHARDKGWQARTYAPPVLVGWLKVGGNLGIRLGPSHLVLD